MQMTLNMDEPEERAIFENNKRVLGSFDERTPRNLLGVIQANGYKLYRFEGGAWLKQWYIDADPALDPLVNALAITFNTALSQSEHNIEIFHQNREALNKANKSMGELKKVMGDIEVIKDAYTYRYGSNPDLALGESIDLLFKRDPEKTYPAQNQSLLTLSKLCTQYREKVTEMTHTWNQMLVDSLNQNPKTFLDLIIGDSLLKRDKEFILTVLKSPNLKAEQRLSIYTLCEASLQQDPDILHSVNLLERAA